MRWYYYLFIIFVLSIFILSGYRAITPQNYNSNGISFDYPGTWTKVSLNQSNNANESMKSDVVAVGDPNNDQNNILVIVTKTKKLGNIEEIVSSSKTDLQKDWGAVIMSDNMIIIDGRQAREIIYQTGRNTNKKERMVIFDKNDVVYCIILGGTISAFDSQKKNFDMIINSFRVTE